MKKLGKITAIILIFAALFWGIVRSLNQTSGQIRNEEAQLIEQRIEQAAVLCYALEGSYPEDVSYLDKTMESSSTMGNTMCFINRSAPI